MSETPEIIKRAASVHTPTEHQAVSMEIRDSLNAAIEQLQILHAALFELERVAGRLQETE